MRIIEIAALSNGAHRNQSYPGFAPDGWAAVPDHMDTPNFPFGEVVVEKLNGIMTVTAWIPGIVPELEPEAEEEQTAQENSVWDELDAAYQEGVDSV